MRKLPRLAVAVVGAGALVGSVLTGALASQPPLQRMIHNQATKNYTVNGNLTITSVLKVKKNDSVYGRVYAHGGEQIWKGLLVRNGGTTTDSLSVKGPSTFDGQAAFQNNVTVGGTLQAAGPINGTSLTLSGPATVGGQLTVDKIAPGTTGVTTMGPLAASSLTTTGNINTGSGTITTSGLTTGALSVQGNVTTTGSITAASISTTGGLTLSGPVDFSRATVTGLNGGTSGNTGTFNTLTVGTASTTSSPLTISANGQTAALGVTNNGTLTTGNLSAGNLSTSGNATVAGTLTVAGTTGITTSVLQAPTPAGSTTQGPLTIQGNGVVINGNTTLGNGSDFNFATPGSGTASHIVANGDTDVAGQVALNVPATTVPSGGFTVSQTFLRPFTRLPIVTVTPTTDPTPPGYFSASATLAPRYWVTSDTNSSGQYGSFTIHFMPGATPTNAYTVTFNYRVSGA